MNAYSQYKNVIMAEGFHKKISTNFMIIHTRFSSLQESYIKTTFSVLLPVLTR
jgi:hypothetical protein